MKRASGVIVTRKVAKSIEQIRADVDAEFDHARIDVDPLDRRGKARESTLCSFGRTTIKVVDCAGGWMRGDVKQDVAFLFTTRGGLLAKHPRFEVAGAPGTIATWAMPGHSFDLRTWAGTSAGVVSIQPVGLVSAGLALFGEEFELRDPDVAPVHEELGRALARNAMFVYHELIELEKSGLAHLVSLTYEDTLSNIALATIYPNAFAETQSLRASPRSIARRACEIMEARASEQISINSLAAELGVTVRALQLSFRKHRGETPLQFLMAQRMKLARSRLLNPKPRDNVQSVAMGCGFTKMSQFSSRYRVLFGELPSETLSRVR